MPTNLGARFYKADFHIHSPKSGDYQDKAITATAFVKAVLAKGLDMIAVTDHNSADWVDEVRSAAKGTPLAVFPGVEITTPLCHILALFDLDRRTREERTTPEAIGHPNTTTPKRTG